MGFEPQKFFVGLIDFFSVWLPGALLVYLIRDDVSPWLSAQGFGLPAETIEGWAVFLVAGYLFGHLIFVIGSIVMDAFDSRVRDVARAKRPRKKWSPSAWLADRLFDDQSHKALAWVKQRKAERLGGADEAINAFQWAKARLAMGHAEALAIVHRFEADSKFFRSLCVVLGILALWSIPTRDWTMLAGALVLLPFAAWRFMELRVKATDQAYWFVIALETSPPPGAAKDQAGSSSA